MWSFEISIWLYIVFLFFTLFAEFQGSICLVAHDSHFVSLSELCFPDQVMSHFYEFTQWGRWYCPRWLQQYLQSHMLFTTLPFSSKNGVYSLSLCYLPSRNGPQKEFFCLVSFKPIEQNQVQFRSQGKLYSLVREWRGMSTHSPGEALGGAAL